MKELGIVKYIKFIIQPMFQDDYRYCYLYERLKRENYDIGMHKNGLFETIAGPYKLQTELCNISKGCF